MLDIDTYLYGRCHLFALVAAEFFGYEIELFWDTDVYLEDRDESITALVHAYNLLPDNRVVDARGIITRKEMIDDYDYSEMFFEKVEVKEIYRLMSINDLAAFEEGEKEKIIFHLSSNLDTYYERNSQ